ncbi:ATP-binding cassette domain-containing protein [Spirosoma sp. HMF4905]|uniref:ATP-binding cassette domain-containing protein n=1 Tax=Spirosoma arboris TaxID=2682092 RepID=A0A7K1SK03_9BACT|nr:ATP-binding cassette domain-containing protein [Spirosoma arboris]MVM34074.1 ATP-binding cassette domain-containing protein [Spirosoma arboris]
MLTVTNLTKAYNGHIALTVPELQLPPGFHYFRGGNGSGKTTLFRTVAGLLPFSGEIVLAGKYEISRDPVAYRMRVNYAEAEPLYPSFLSARDLVGFVSKAKKSPVGQVDAVANLLGVDSFWTKPTGQFSSGMLKKLSLLLALLGTPQLVLLDEPLTTLDVATAEKLFAYIQQLHTSEGVSFLLTSHQDVSLTGLPITSVWQVNEGVITTTT